VESLLAEVHHQKRIKGGKRMNVIELLMSTTQRKPEKVALVFKGEKYTYQQLQEQIFRVAYGLKQLGITDNKNVGLMMTNRPEYVITYFAILAVGASVVPINPLFKEQEVTYILNDSEAEFLFIDELALKTVERLTTVLPKELKIISCAKRQMEKYIPWISMLTSQAIEQPVQRKITDIAQINYTSGTTGHPKGAMITHSNLNWMAIACGSNFDVWPTDRVLCALPLFHAYAKLQCLLSPVTQGATIYLEERFETASVLKSMEENQITVYFGVPTMYTMFVHFPEISAYNLEHLRACFSGGASIPVEIIEKVKETMGVEICEGYGLTESTVGLTCNPVRGMKKIGSVGIPMAGVDLKIVDSEGIDVDLKQIGEIIFNGPNAMKGYYKKPEETENAIKNGWVYTGDLGYQDEEGYIYIVDRKKDMIIRGGYNVYPREIEEVIYTHKNVVECAVIGRPDPLYGERIVAYIVTNDNNNQEEFIRYCKERLVHYKIPDVICFIDELPKSGTGKILKVPLKKLDKSLVD
jgi:long-chain acyl-CoA synthetase